MKKIIKSICFSLLAFMFAIGSIFLPLGKQPQKYASADTTILGNTIFTSSDIIYSATAYTSTQYSDFNSYVDNSLTNDIASRSILNYSFQISLDSVSNSYYNLTFGYRGYYNNEYGLRLAEGTQTLKNDFISTTLSINTPSTMSQYRDFAGLYSKCYLQFGNTGTYYSCIGFVVDWSEATSDIPSLVISSIELGSSESNNGFVRLNYYDFDDTLRLSFKDCNIVCYTDTNGFRYIYYIPSYFDSSDISQFFLTYRKYYTSNAFDFSNNGIYQQGVLDGRSEGYDSGYNEGYREGTSVGYEHGFENGKIEGAIESNNYSFFGLISAVIDAPVKILTSLFNFNFLGVNLWAFFTSILTISLIIFVIRKFMAKG